MLDELKVGNFLHRLKSLQRLCSGSNSNFPMGILIVPGLDGRSNKAAIQLIKYLFCGSVGKDLLEGILDTEFEPLEEIILLIQESSISVLWSHEMKDLIGDTLNSYPVVIEYMTSKIEESEIDLSQARKCCDFKRMILESVKGGGGIGIPLPMGYDTVQDLESWPILQAFALDSCYTPTGFFTARYNVFDISTYLEIMFHSVDGNCVDNAIDVLRRSILPHVNQSISMLDALTSSQRSRITADEAIGPLDMLFEFGSIECAFPPDPSLRPTIFFGSDTSINASGGSLNGWQNKLAGKNYHAVIEGCEPSTGLRFCRTYLLQRGKCLEFPQDIDALVYAEGQGSEFWTSDNEEIINADNVIDLSVVNVISRLELLYIKLWIGLRSIVKYSFSLHKDVLEAGTYVQQLMDLIMKGKHVEGISMNDELSGLMLDKVVLLPGERLQVHMDCINGIGQIVTIEDVDDMGGSCWAYIRVSIHGISLGNDEEGAVAVGDTFLFIPEATSIFNALQKNNNQTKNDILPLLSDCFCITHSIPYYRCIIGGGAEEKSAERLLSCLRNSHMLAVMGVGKMIETSGTGIVHIPVMTDHPLLPFINCDLRCFTSGFVIEKMTTTCLPIIISIGTHVEEMFTMDIADVLDQALHMIPGFECPVSTPNGLFIAFKIKSNYDDSKSNKEDIKTSTDYDEKYNRYNTLERSLPLVGKCQHIGFFIPTGSRMSTTITTACKDWRISLRVHDIPERKGSNCKIPIGLLRSYLTTIDAWSSINHENTLFNESEKVSAEEIIDVAKSLSLTSHNNYNSIKTMPATGFFSMRCMHSISESRRLYNTNDVDPIVSSEMSSFKRSVVVVVGHSGSGVLHVGSQIKIRLGNSLSGGGNIQSVTIDLVSSDSELDINDIINKAINDISSTSSPIIASIITSPSNHGRFSDIISSLSKISTALPVCIISVLSSTALGFNEEDVIDGYAGLPLSESLYGLGVETWKASTLEMCQSGLCDMVIVLEEVKESIGYSNVKTWLQNLNSTATIYKITPINMRLHDDTIEYLQEKIEKYQKLLKNSSISTIPFSTRPITMLRLGLCGNTTGINSPQTQTATIYRKSQNPMVIGKGLTSFTINHNIISNNTTKSIWDLTNLLQTLQLLFPSAIVNSMNMDDSWSIPENKEGLVGWKRAIVLAKTKVMTSRQYEEGKAIFSKKLNSFVNENKKELKSIQSGIISLHGIIRLRSGTFLSLKANENSNNSINSTYKSKSLQSNWAYIEASKGVVIVRSIDDKTLISRLEMNEKYRGELTFQGIFNDPDIVQIKQLLSYCQPHLLQKKKYVKSEDLNEWNHIQIQKKYNDLVKLGDGWWFDGNSYIDMKGSRRRIREDIELLVTIYLKKVNEDIKLYNSLVDEVSSNV